LHSRDHANIPWIHGLDWQTVSSSIPQTLPLSNGHQSKFVKLAGQISSHYQDLEAGLELLCSHACSLCEDICCQRATVWYDLKDLLYIYISSGALPERQIFRHNDGACCYLKSSGCAIDRSRRPFICTWYICHSQKEKAGESSGLDLEGVLEKIHKVKDLRNQLGSLYVKHAVTSIL